jgi:hypothetical protein
MSEPSPPPEEKATGLRFDEAAVKEMREAATLVFSRHPEVRSIAVVFDYRGALNDANVNKALWLGPDGPVRKLDGMFGSLANMLRLTDHMFSLAAAEELRLRESAAKAAVELIQTRVNSTVREGE